MSGGSRCIALLILLVVPPFVGCKKPESEANARPTGEPSAESASPSPSGSTVSSEPMPAAAPQPDASVHREDGSGGDSSESDVATPKPAAANSHGSSNSGEVSPQGNGSDSGSARQPVAPGPKFTTSASAHEFATEQRSDAKRLSADDEKAEAYEAALKGWSALQPHLADPKCQKLSGVLLSELEKYGEALGEQGHSVLGKPLKIK